MYTQESLEKGNLIEKKIGKILLFSTTACRQHVLYCAAIQSALSTVSKYHTRSAVHFNINISRTLLELIANYDTSLLVSDVCANYAASNDARVHDYRVRFISQDNCVILQLYLYYCK